MDSTRARRADTSHGRVRARASESPRSGDASTSLRFGDASKSLRAGETFDELARRLVGVAASSKASPPRFALDELRGRLVELVGRPLGASVTLAFRLILEAQAAGEWAAWIGGTESSFFPPDAADVGVDLDALLVVRVRRAGDRARAADMLARSGACGLVVVDLDGPSDVPIAVQARLLAAAQKHDGAVVFLSSAERAPLGSLISLRGSTTIERLASGELVCELQADKDKRRAPGWRHVERCAPLSGLEARPLDERSP